jgi:hypothetical protein
MMRAMHFSNTRVDVTQTERVCVDIKTETVSTWPLFGDKAPVKSFLCCVG